MKVGKIRTLAQVGPFEAPRLRRGLAACHEVSDLKQLARRRIPKPVFDYVDGGADEELAAAENSDAYRRRRFTPTVLCDVSSVNTGTAVFGAEQAAPFVLAPVGLARMLHSDGEVGAARAAARHGLPYTLSTMATTGLADLAAAAVGLSAAGCKPDRWFQLYVLKARDQVAMLLDRAHEADYRTLVVTVDTAVAGNRVRDMRNGLALPPALSARTAWQVVRKPGYWTRLLTGPSLDFANFSGMPRTTVMASMSGFDASLSWQTIDDLRARWPGNLVLKGPIGPADARRAVDAGVDGLQLSNHGGRQLDRVVAPLDLIAPVRDAVGPLVTVLVDSGVRHGADAAIALALGADAVAIGRAYAYGLMAGGEAGVDRVLDILHAQFRSTLALLGVRSVAELRAHGGSLVSERVASCGH